MPKKTEELQVPVRVAEAIIKLFKERDIVEFNLKTLTLKTYRKKEE